MRLDLFIGGKGVLSFLLEFVFFFQHLGGKSHSLMFHYFKLPFQEYMNVGKELQVYYFKLSNIFSSKGNDW